jgi:MFS family permease
MIFGVTMAISGRRSSLILTGAVTYSITALAGWAADYITGRFSFLSGLGLLFLSMTVICLALNPWILLLSRASQGLASTMIYTSGLALIAHSVSADEVGSWLHCVPD